MIVVVSLGGSILTPPDASTLKAYADVIRQASADHKLIVVAGGGRTAR